MARILAATIILFCAAIASPQQASAEGLISTGNASLYYLKYPQRVVVFYYPGELNASSRSSENPVLKTHRTDITLQAKNIQPIVVTGDSAKPGDLQINGKEYHLSAGSLFRVSAKGEILQLPFAPLEPTEAYLAALRSYFGR